MNEGSIILASIQQSDGQFKPRPVLVVKITEPYGDFIVVAISSKLRQEVKGLDIILPKHDDANQKTGLKVNSLLRIGLLATIPNKTMLGNLGEVDNYTLSLAQSRLAQLFKSSL